MDRELSKITFGSEPVRKASLSLRASEPNEKIHAVKFFRILVGLGNPDKKYESTYHNAGRLFADYLLENLSSEQNGDGKKFAKPTASKNFEYLKTRNFIFVRPFLFMNESGAAIQAALKFFNVKPEELLVIHDDGDIEIGSYKISFGRGAGGHHGAESIIQKLRTKNFWRLRIGIRQAADKRGLETQMDADTIGVNQRRNLRKFAIRARAGDFVLKKISHTDEKILYSTFEDIESRLFEK